MGSQLQPFSTIPPSQQHLNKLLQQELVKNNHLMVDSLLQRGANPNGIFIKKVIGYYNNETTARESVLHHILSKLEETRGLKEVQSKFYKMFYSLLEKISNENLNMQSYYGETLLHGAALLNDKKLILTLLEKGVDANITNNSGDTAVDLYVSILEAQLKIPDPEIIEAFTDAMVSPALKV
jgi:ankyrin repeat protein